VSRFTPRQHRIAHAAKVEAFAELLAEGKTVPAASAICGEHQSWGNNVLQGMRRRLGLEQCR
jgi:hypothetical protein